MKIRVLKPHFQYPPGEHEVTTERGNYLISHKIAEEVTDNEVTYEEIIPDDQPAKPKKGRKKKSK